MGGNPYLRRYNLKSRYTILFLKMEIKINPKKKKIVISYDINEESKKIISQAQSLAEHLPDYLLKIVQTSSKSKKDKESRS